MARIRVFLVLALALTAGAVLAYGTYSFMQNQPARTVTVPTRGVVVAAADLPIGTELRMDDLRTLTWPAGGVPEGSFTQPAELVGRGVISQQSDPTNGCWNPLQRSMVIGDELATIGFDRIQFNDRSTLEVRDSVHWGTPDQYGCYWYVD